MSTIQKNRNEALRRALFFSLAAISVGLTATFFSRNLRFQSLENISPILGITVSILLGLLSADLGALIWREIYLRSCRSAPQVLISQVMMGLTLLLASATTLAAIGEAYVGASLMPESWGVWLGWLVVLVVAVEFIFGSFLFTLFSPETKIDRQIMESLIEDAEAVSNQVRIEMERNRDARVRALADQLSAEADMMIYAALSSNPRGLPSPPLRGSGEPVRARVVPSPNGSGYRFTEGSSE